MSLRRFTNPKNLRGLGRPLLSRFFAKFSTELKTCKARLPSESLEDDDEYFALLAKVFLSPKDLPTEMTEALYAAVEMANPAGVERLTKAVRDQGLKIEWEERSSDLDIAMQVWLADPILMTVQHSEHRLMAMTSFQYWGTKTPAGDRFKFSPPTEGAVEELQKAVDTWCRENLRGDEGVAVSKHFLDDEWWFLIQHGGTMSRLPMLESRKAKILFYRPGKDDVVVYNVERDELRIHAGTKGERNLYREEFGQRLRGDTSYFSERKNFVLDPLRADITKALNPEGVSEIKSIVLQEYEIVFGGDFDDRLIRKSADMLKSAAQRQKQEVPIKVIPDGGTLVRAVFEIEFNHSKKPRKVYLRPPDELRIGRHGDLKAIQTWLSLRGFRASSPATNHT